MPEPAKLVIVTGSGRSGTSTVAGTLKRLGLHIPQPEKPADEINPRGFYETVWVNDFHDRILESVPARTNDARPAVAEQIRAAAAAPEVHDELRDWLSAQVAEAGPAGRLAVKDPRTFWVADLWGEVAAELGVELAYLTMVRHPAEVVRSRTVAFHADKTDEFVHTRQTANLAAWVNAMVETEAATRSRPRAFVRYADLLTDWRAAMARAGEQLDISFDADLSSREPHPVDDFIDVKLQHAKASWDGTDSLPELLDLGARSWDAANRLVDAPYDEGAIEALEQVHPAYVRLHHLAEAIAHDRTTAEVAQARRKLQQRIEKKDRRIADLQAEVRELRNQQGDQQGGRSRLPWRR